MMIMMAVMMKILRTTLMTGIVSLIINNPYYSQSYYLSSIHVHNTTFSNLFSKYV
jgi:hypothetical protein